MGGRGASSGVNNASKALWDYRGIAERVSQLEDTYQRSNAPNRDVVISRSVKAQDTIINHEIDLIRNGKKTVTKEHCCLIGADYVS